MVRMVVGGGARSIVFLLVTGFPLHGIRWLSTYLRRENPAIFLETAICMSASRARRFARWRQSPIEGPSTHRRRQTRHSSIHAPLLCA